jgi:hypothetical protein
MQVLDAADTNLENDRTVPAVEYREVVERAEARLRSSAYRELRDVFCSYRDGILTLHGRVSSFYLKQLAQALTAGLDGIARLNNRLEVVD